MLRYLIHRLGPIDELVADDILVLTEWGVAGGHKLIPQNNDCAIVLLRFAQGMVVPILACWTVAQAECWAVDVWGTDGRILTTSPIFPTSPDGKLLAACPTGIAGFSSHPVPPVYPMALSMNPMVRAIRG